MESLPGHTLPVAVNRGSFSRSVANCLIFLGPRWHSISLALTKSTWRARESWWGIIPRNQCWTWWFKKLSQPVDGNSTRSWWRSRSQPEIPVKYDVKWSNQTESLNFFIIMGDLVGFPGSRFVRFKCGNLRSLLVSEMLQTFEESWIDINNK